MRSSSLRQAANTVPQPLPVATAGEFTADLPVADPTLLMTITPDLLNEADIPTEEMPVIPAYTPPAGNHYRHLPVRSAGERLLRGAVWSTLALVGATALAYLGVRAGNDQPGNSGENPAAVATTTTSRPPQSTTSIVPTTRRQPEITVAQVPASTSTTKEPTTSTTRPLIIVTIPALDTQRTTTTEGRTTTSSTVGTTTTAAPTTTRPTTTLVSPPSSTPNSQPVTSR